MPLLYIHHASAISPQHTFPETDLALLNPPVDNLLKVSEPDYAGIPAGILRRMGKAVRIGVGAAVPLLKQTPVEGIIIGTANGGMEDCIKFLNQIIEYDEGRLTPGNFVGSTPNAIAAQLGLLQANKGYNITHVQSGVSFENALLDAAMLVEENPGEYYLVGGLDEISTYNFNIDWLAGWFKRESIGANFYTADTPGTIAGEGAAMYIVSGEKENALLQLDALSFFYGDDSSDVVARVAKFLEENIDHAPDILLSGENGDSRFLENYNAVEQLFPAIAITRFKHMSGEFATASALGLFFGSRMLAAQSLPAHMIKRPATNGNFQTILMYNQYKERQHSLMLFSLPKK